LASIPACRCAHAGYLLKMKNFAAQHPLQMLTRPRSISRLRSLTVCRSGWRGRRAPWRSGTSLSRELDPTVPDGGSLALTDGDDIRGGKTGLRFGCGSGATLDALPTPLGSRTEPLSPRAAFPGPAGMPLTSVPWARAGRGDARGSSIAAAMSIAPAMMRWRGESGTDVRGMDR
jgi:hypothetical protein